MAAPDIKIRGIRSPIPTGYVLGRSAPGVGDTELIDMTTLASQISQTGITQPAAPGTGGINQLTGDVTAGPGTGSQVATLANTSVTPGSYTLTSLTVNSKGLITAASSGVAVTNVATGTGLTGGPITTTGTISLANTAVTPGFYTHASITVDAQGRLTSAASGSVGVLPLVTGDIPVGILTDSTGQTIGVPV